MNDYQDTLEPPTDDDKARIVSAIASGWGFQGARMSYAETSRHALWVHNPDEEGWVCHKVSGSEKKWFKALLDEAEVLQ